MDNWIDTEFASLDLNDKRLDRRARLILSSFNNYPAKTIPQAFQSWVDIKSCYNFFDNPKATYKKITSPHIERTIERIKMHPVVLIPTDTSVLDYDSKVSMQGKGGVCQHREGIFLHASVAITPDRSNLGITETNLWVRGVDYPSNKGSNRKKIPIEQKESLRWLESYRASCKIAEKCPETQIINIADRECDIIEILEEAVERKQSGQVADVIIRSQHNRQLNEKDPDNNKKYKRLIKSLEISSPIAEIEYNVAPTHGEKARKVIQNVRAGSFKFRTKKYSGGTVRSVTINVVMATEENPPEGEKPIQWILITTLPIDSAANAIKVIEYYLCRWEIEVFFKILKSGCKVEERQLSETDRMKPLIAIFAILAWRIQYVMMLGRACPDIPCTSVFEDSEWKSVYRILNKNLELPKDPPTLNEFILMIAQLGGYIPGKKASPPGAKVMWRGMARMSEFSIAWQAFGGG